MIGLRPARWFMLKDGVTSFLFSGLVVGWPCLWCWSVKVGDEEKAEDGEERLLSLSDRRLGVLAGVVLLFDGFFSISCPCLSISSYFSLSSPSFHHLLPVFLCD